MVKFNLKKKIAKALVFAMVMGTVGVHGLSLKSPVSAYAAEETVTAPEITVDYGTATATITSKNTENDIKKDKFVFLEVLKDASGSKVSATYAFELKGNTPVTVDLSFLKVAKNTYLRAYGDADMEKKSAVTTVGIQPKKVSIKYVPGSDSVLKSFQVNKAEATGAVLAQYDIATLLGGVGGLGHTTTESGYEVKNIFLDSKTADSGTTYKTYDDVLNQLKITGTTLIFRQKAVEKTDKTEGSFAGLEVKVKISAIPKAPKVTVDYVKGTVKLSKNAQYSLVGETQADTADNTKQVQKWIDCSSGATLDPTTIVINVKGLTGDSAKTDALEALKKGVILMVRTKADKKDASQVTFITLKAAPVLKDGSGQIAITKEDDPDTATDKALAYKNTENGMELTAKGAAFDYLVSGTWKTLQAGKSVVLKGTTTVEVRSSGVKADTKNNVAGVFPSTSAKIVVASNAPTFDKDKLMVTASKDNTLTFTSKAGDTGHTALVVGSAKYEYRVKTEDNDETYAEIVSGTTKLTPGKTYEIRVAKTDTSKESEPVAVYLPLIAAATPTLDNLSVVVATDLKLVFAAETDKSGYKATITGSTVTYEYASSGSTQYTPIDGNTKLVHGKYSIRVTVTANGVTSAPSEAIEIELPEIK